MIENVEDTCIDIMLNYIGTLMSVEEQEISLLIWITTWMIQVTQEPKAVSRKGFFFFYSFVSVEVYAIEMQMVNIFFLIGLCDLHRTYHTKIFFKH